ncbi:MAG: succinate dehydrogenase cytochrome b subunit [Cyclobacteriaceae bacterium]|jgi:succinate dehydrogenase / fumarate reductase cytochrome b subunit|nr:succinate dehydrogenase cytochrome b subunit [Cyclobacteriaceae bacterium]
MKWFIDLFTSTLGRKALMALTGLFLVLFLAVHLAGNLQLLKDDGGRAFNIYAEFMSTNPLIQTVSKGNFAFILLHIAMSVYLTIKNRQARGPEGYAITSGKSSAWTSRNMGILGTLVLVFLVIHLKDFYGQMHFGQMEIVEYEGESYRNIYATVSYWFDKEWYVAVYVFCMAAVGFHLWHGFTSAFQTLGWSHPKYNPVINFVGKAFAVVVPALFALIPIWMYLN